MAKRKVRIIKDDRPCRICPDQEKPPSGKNLLLTIGNIAVTGVWTNEGRYKAWQRLLRRDKVHAARLGWTYGQGR